MGFARAIFDLKLKIVIGKSNLDVGYYPLAHAFYTVSESKFPKIQQISLKIIIFTVDKRLQTVITRENLFFRSFLEVSSGICVQNLRFRNKILPFVL